MTITRKWTIFALAIMLALSLLAGYALGQTQTFTDVPPSHTHFEPIEWGAEHDILLGFGDGTFRPNDPVSRGQVASMLFRYDSTFGSGGGQPTEEPTEEECTAAGAGAGASTLGVTEYDESTVVENVVFDGAAGDDLVRVVDEAHVVFKNVTFDGSANAHLLEVGVGDGTTGQDNASVEVRCSKFTGAPGEDHIQFKNDGNSVVTETVFESDPDEDHIDIKEGGDVDIIGNTFADVDKWCVLANNGAKTVNVVGNDCPNGGMYLRGGVTGEYLGNTMGNALWLDDVTDLLVEGNTFADEIRYGAGSNPEDVYFLNNEIDEWDYRAGTCFEDGNTGADLTGDCTAGPPAWYVP